MNSESNTEPLHLPVIPLRDVVIFPGVKTVISAGRPGTLEAIKRAAKGEDKRVFAVSQRVNTDEAAPEGLYTIGTVARVDQLQRFAGGVAAATRGRAPRHRDADRRNDDHFEAVVGRPRRCGPRTQRSRRSWRCSGRCASAPPSWPEGRAARGGRQRAARRGGGWGTTRRSRREPSGSRRGRQAGASRDAVRRRPPAPGARPPPAPDRGDRRSVGHQVAQRQQELGDRQREMVLREQLKAIEQELGDGDDGGELEELREALDALEFSESVRKEVDRELRRLGRLNKESMEYQVARGFLEVIAELPWNERSDEGIDLQRAHEILEEDHYGLTDVKDRVLEFLAVRQLHQRKAERSSEEAEAGDVEAGDRQPAPGAEPVVHTAGARPRRSAGRGRARRPHEESAHPALRRASGCRQDLDRQVDRPRDRARVRSRRARRGAGRGGDPRPSAHLRRRDAGPDHPGHAPGGQAQPGLLARRGRQARR